MDVIKKIQQFVSYWYLRYLLATELYIVETWERVVVHITLAILFGLVWLFNYTIVFGSISKLRNSATHWQDINVN